MHLNIEIKASCRNPEAIRKILLEANAEYKGCDEQEDTYFNIPDGRLKLRLGPIEKSLIHYNRQDQAGPKTSEVTMTQVTNGELIKAVLVKALGIKVVVEKKRDIYFIENVKFHLDYLPALGNFVEIEAIDIDGTIGKERLEEQCNHYIQLFGIDQADFIKISYSDMILNADRTST